MPGADRDGLTAGPADRLQAVGGAIVALDSGLGHMSDNLAAVSRLMSEVWHGKFNAVRIKELEFPYVNQVRPPLMANNTRRAPRIFRSHRCS